MGSELSRWVEERLDADASVTDEAGLLVLAALEGRESLDGYLAGGAAPTKPGDVAADVKPPATMSPPGPS